MLNVCEFKQQNMDKNRFSRLTKEHDVIMCNLALSKIHEMLPFQFNLRVLAELTGNRTDIQTLERRHILPNAYMQEKDRDTERATEKEFI